MDGRSKNGGARKGAGRKTKVEEEKANKVFLTALKELHNEDTNDGAKIAFVKVLYKSERGKIFIAEHVFGKAPQVIEAGLGQVTEIVRTVIG